MKKLIFSLAALAALVSCKQEKIETPSLFREVKIMASTAETKTQLSENEVVWESGDALSLNFAKKTGEANLETFTTTGTGSSATFTGKLSNNVNSTDYNETVYAVYPNTAMQSDGTVSFSLPAARQATYGSFPSGQNLSSAAIALSDFEDGNASATFRNALSIVRFTLDADVASVEITASGDLAGSADMQFDGDGRLEVKTMTAGEKVLTVTPAEGDSFDASEVYNILVYPGNHTSLSVEITDIHGCTYTKEVTGTYEFVPANFYTFNFNTQYVKVYTFSVESGLTVTAGSTKMAVVYEDATSVVQDEIVTADASSKFTVNLTEAVVHGNDINGYAIYPVEAYSESTGKITCVINESASGQLGYGGTGVMSAKLGSESLTFTGCTDAIGKITYEAPSGATVTKIVADKGISGSATMKVDEAGKLYVTGEGSDKEIASIASPASGYAYVYPVENATLTVSLFDGLATVNKVITNFTIAAGETKALDLSGVNFDKSGSFENEGFTDGLGIGNEIEF